MRQPVRKGDAAFLMQYVRALGYHVPLSTS
jgi:hypothetical protein